MELVFAAESEFLRDVWIDQGLNRKTSMPVVVLFDVQ